MSDRSREQAQSGTASTADGKGESGTRSPRPGYTFQRKGTGSRSVTSPIAQNAPSNPLDLPPLPSAPPNSGSFTHPAPRLASFASLLNPSPSDADSTNRRRKASHLDSLLSAAQPLPPTFTRSEAHRASPTTVVSAAPNVASIEQPQRRILTPRSPALQRAASLGQLNQSTGTINARQTPFPSSPRSRTYGIQPGTGGAPSLPTPPPITGGGYGFPGPEQSAQSSHRGSAEYRGQSSSASPSTSYSSYSQAGQVSPTTQYASISSGTGPTGYTGSSDPSYGGIRQASMMDNPMGSDRQGPFGIPISSSGSQNVYQMMSLETTAGTVQLPVDVQGASHVADEKRRRNAGASARFRQRRKEKERESTTAIGKLEQHVKDFGEDADFYRRERDLLVGILRHVPGAERHFPRPPSPRRRRSSNVSTMSLPGPTGIGTAAFPMAQEPMMQSRGDGRNVRRRTSTMSLPPPPLSQQYPGTPMQPSYRHQPFGGPLGPAPPPAPQRSSYGAPPPPTQNCQLLPPSESPARRHQQLPGIPQVLGPPPQWGPYSGPPRPQDPDQPRENR